MLGKIRRVDFSFDEWLAGTAELDPAERGVYITACALIYSRGGPIALDVLRSFCPCDLRLYKRCLDRLLSLSKLSLTSGYLSNKRCLSELQVAAKRMLSAAQNGAKGGRPSNKINGLTKPPGLISEKLSSTTNTNYQPSEESIVESKDSTRVAKSARRPVGVPDGFNDWYEGWPHKVGKQAAIRAFGKAIKLAPLTELVDATLRYVRDKPPDRPWCNPATWLNEHRWLDKPAMNGANGHDEHFPVPQRRTPDAPPPKIVFGADN